MSAARSALGRLQLADFHVDTEDEFLRRLDRQTLHIQRSFPTGGRNWGAARKSLNIYLRDVVYSAALRDHFGLTGIHNWLEVPLDSYIAKGLGSESEGQSLPRWPGVKHVTPEISQIYQSAASKIARRRELTRVDLDVIYWRNSERD
ncbi:MAG: hypothetical protein SH850_01595 [Planctomycetaceae bacterium]|nr:hypothetical protein [Planctomycetaceae bacterium]